MPNIFSGRVISFTLRDDWVPDPRVAPFMAQQFSTYRFVPQASMQDGILYGVMQIREILNPMEKMTVANQLQMLTYPQMAAMILGNLGVQPQAMAGGMQQVQLKGGNCNYRIVDGADMLSGQPVRCYLGLIDMGMYSIEVISIILSSIWAVLLPQVLEIFTSITPLGQGGVAASSQQTPIFVNQDASGKISYKLQQQDGTLKIFDELKDKGNVQIIHIDHVDHIIQGQDFKVEGVTMGDRTVNISGQAKVTGNISQDVNIDNSVKSEFNAEEFSKVVEQLLAAVKQTQANDNYAKMAVNKLEEIKLQIGMKEDTGSIGNTLKSVAGYMKQSEEIVNSGANIGQLLLKAGKLAMTAISWL